MIDDITVNLLDFINYISQTDDIQDVNDGKVNLLAPSLCYGPGLSAYN